MSWGTALGLIGVGLQAYGAYKSSEAAEDQAETQAANIQEVAAHNAAISRFDAAITRQAAGEVWFKTNREVDQFHQSADAFLATQRTRFAKSGVAVKEGTPIEVMNRTIDEFKEDEKIIKYEGLKEIERLEDSAKRYDLLSDFGLRDASAAASLVLAAGQDRADAYKIEGVTQAASQLYDVGYNQKWWD